MDMGLPTNEPRLRRAVLLSADEALRQRMQRLTALFQGPGLECECLADPATAGERLAGGGVDLCLAEPALAGQVEPAALGACGALVVLGTDPGAPRLPGLLTEVLDPGRLDDFSLATCLRLCLARAVERALARHVRDDLPAMVFSLDANGAIASVNRFGSEKLGYPEAELIGRAFSAICLDMDANDLKLYLRRVFDTPGNILRIDSTLLTREHLPLWVEQTARSVVDDQGVASALVICQDNSENRRLSEALSYSESHDSLTGLFNRHYFEQMLGRLSAEARWNRQEHVLVYMDIDQFKVINDVSGHGAGDELIRRVSTLLRERVRRGDVLARLGGDEFAIVLADCPLERAHAITDSLRDALAALKFNHDGRLYRITASFGMVSVNGDDANVAMTLGKADTACFTAKEAGRNRVHLFEAENGDALRRRGEMEWVSRVNDALENDNLILFAQGIYDLHDAKRPPGFEVLVRLRDGDTIVPPGMFLPAVERFNLSADVDRRVIEKLLDWCESNPEFLDRIGRWSVNLSGVTMSDSKFSDWLKDKFRNSRLPPSKVCFEVTETAAISNLDLACEFICEMKTLGFRFALDDFGSGLSSFAYLKELPVNTVKIDGIFVRDIAESPIHRAMVRSITEIAHLMGKTVVGEFVEDDRVADLLRSLGVDAGQGYGLGRPMPIDELLRSEPLGRSSARSAA